MHVPLICPKPAQKYKDWKVAQSIKYYWAPSSFLHLVEFTFCPQVWSLCWYRIFWAHFVFVNRKFACASGMRGPLSIFWCISRLLGSFFPLFLFFLSLVGFDKVAKEAYVWLAWKFFGKGWRRAQGQLQFAWISVFGRITWWLLRGSYYWPWN